jgi:hypothetical protein
MKTGVGFFVLILFLIFITIPASAGPYPPAAGQEGSTAVSIKKDDPAYVDFVAWATGYENYWPGANVSDTFKTPVRALGPAQGISYDEGKNVSPTVTLGDGGQITLLFDSPIVDGEGWDFAVFENSFNDTFLELAYVEVSSDGVNFVRFDNDSQTLWPVPPFGAIDPTEIDGFAGKYKAGYGTPFDLSSLASKSQVLDGTLQLSRITHIRIVDIVGDGTATDTSGDVIWDPWGPDPNPSAGFDLDAIGVLHQASEVETAVDIKVNGSDSTVTVPQGTPVTISLAVTAGGHVNQNVDWWLVHYDSTDWLSFVITDGWVNGIKPVFQFPLFDLPLTALFQLVLPPGIHTFYFAVDDNADGNPDATWWDFVTVVIE